MVAKGSSTQEEPPPSFRFRSAGACWPGRSVSGVSRCYSGKKAPFCSCPICAKREVVVEAGSETNWNPWRVSLGGVVAVTSIVAEFSRKNPANLSTGSLKSIVFVIPLQWIRSESMMEGTRGTT